MHYGSIIGQFSRSLTVCTAVKLLTETTMARMIILLFGNPTGVTTPLIIIVFHSEHHYLEVNVVIFITKCPVITTQINRVL